MYWRRILHALETTAILVMAASMVYVSSLLAYVISRVLN